MVSLNDRAFSRHEAEQLIQRHFPESAEVLNASLLPGITFVNDPSETGRPALRLGGGARLPASIEWPVNGDCDLFHVATVDLALVGPLDVTGALPDAGTLLFFYDIVSSNWGLDANDSDAWRVIWVTAADGAAARERDRQPHSSDEHFLLPPSIDADTVPTARPTWTMPMKWEPWVDDTFYFDHTRDEYWQRREDFDAVDALHCKDFQMLGWPYYMQGWSPHESVAGYASGLGESAVDPDDAAEWRLLMEFSRWDEYGGTKWASPDGGNLQYWIKDADLRARRFDRVWIHVDAW